ncbi:penicillin-binding protein 6 [Kushneria sinocarnis]|uniref:serine-type D-Ala-D-Ala carboxypeptidase n=1 Tax=Kushneria sinocarnis TaxID=595502 RepID=A0A420WZ50_9GAMM|nr:D-alanyl-D-alanine carboxypeptidase family protein [Kushneria sinocarnis]RKR06405.1 penicillin-binding protein 6 [Kushneria sinocarnis]
MTLLAAPKSCWRQLIALIGLALTLIASPAWAEDARGIASFVPSPPSLNAKSWVLMDAKSGQILVQHDADERLPPASLTKMMTAYITEYEIDHGDLSEDDKIRISNNAWQTGGSRMFVKVGSYVPLKDLMQGIVVQSGNDATVAVAEHVAGSESAFATLMNQYAQSMGLKNTHFENPTGLPSEGHYSSAHDLAIIARHIINDFPDHYKLYSEKYFTWNDIRQPNRNLLLWRDKSVDGLKTGHTEEAGYCLVSSASREGTRLIAVVMGTKSEDARAQESQKLLNYGFRYFETRKLYSKGDVLNRARVWGGAQDEVPIGVDHDVYTTISAQSDDKLNARLNIQSDLSAPISKGQQLGTLEVVQGDKSIDQEPLVALSAVDEGGFIKRMWDQVVKFVLGLFD